MSNQKKEHPNEEQSTSPYRERIRIDKALRQAQQIILPVSKEKDIDTVRRRAGLFSDKELSSSRENTCESIISRLQ